MRVVPSLLHPDLRSATIAGTMAVHRDALYFDYNATTPLHRRVRDAMVQVLDDFSGNPSSLHAFGRRARKLVEDSRERLAAYLQVDPYTLFFTSGGTESNNIAISGVTEKRSPLWISAGEHPSVVEPARRRWRDGAAGGFLPIDSAGRVDPQVIARCESLQSGLVSVQWVNNETGVIQDVAALASEARKRGAFFHCDGAQGFFRLPDRLPALDVDLATLTAHKSFGPVGVGVLYFRKGVVVEPLLHGGPQERQVRPGTENLAAIHGLGVLAELAGAAPLWPRERLAPLQARLRARIQAIDGVRIVTPEANAFPNTLSIAVFGFDAETLLVRLDMVGIAASSGSACSSGAREPSRVLRAMGIPEPEVRGALRFSFGPDTTEVLIDTVAERLANIIRDLRGRRS